MHRRRQAGPKELAEASEVRSEGLGRDRKVRLVVIRPRDGVCQQRRCAWPREGEVTLDPRSKARKQAIDRDSRV